MPKGNAPQTKVHYKGQNEDFIVFVDDREAVLNWRKDKSIPLAQVVSGWKFFKTHKHGTQGVLDGASKGDLQNEFGSDDDDTVMKAILEKGDILHSEAAERQGPKNDSKGPMISH
ncbi:shwachman-Bodian-diamond syndrome protein [Xylona heveae TC161]|uniref:Shwachman-Bodian-diamond syndrome protein n=1 Tax=Xylona heveae (strain CBS 132557 / TC161) TaxID=1328760 RepID=A0A165I1U2_XYLHT|nr:shwachman-Bodian-diamond syndrome protein [Xylona heveae TC161]KZF24239.1 shwachman-Bodian-diamond syndrome protein [Xylona heveae TC161]